MPTATRKRYAGVELGGTKVICVLADGDTLVDTATFATTSPDGTLGAARRCLRDWDAQQAIAGLGIASFGPIRLDPAADNFGRMQATPKPGWSGAPILAALSDGINVPYAIDTDVNAAALAEHRWGGGQGCSSLVYLTIGTGLGGGVLVEGVPIHGRLHPEIGHLLLRRHPEDRFRGVCPFHGDCIEGLVSGPALAARFGKAAELVGADAPEWDHAAHDLAQLLATLIHTVAPQRILVGGGVGLKAPHLLARAVSHLPKLLGGYYPDLTPVMLQDMIRPAVLGAEAGPKGAIRLAQIAEERGS